MNSSEGTPVFVATKFGNFEVLKMLLDANARPDAFYGEDNALSLAVKKKKTRSFFYNL